LKSDGFQTKYPSEKAAGDLYTMEIAIKKIGIFKPISLIFGLFRQKNRKIRDKRQIYSMTEDLVYLPEHMKRDIGWLEESPRDCNKLNK
jgi:folate-dependent tRNA-U54 methylase TrmFO/GidA